MPAEKPFEPKKAAAREDEIPKPAISLATSPFLEPSRQAVGEAINSVIRGNNSRQQIGKIGDIPLIRRPFIGSSLGAMSPERGEVAAYASQQDFLVLQIGKGMMMIGLPKEFGLTPAAMASIAKKGYKKGDLPELDKLISSYSDGDMKVNAIFIGYPVDCLQFINRSIAPSGARKVRGRTTEDLAGALARPGNAILARRRDFESADKPGVQEPAKIADFSSNAKVGDVVMFLGPAPDVKTVGEAREYETNSDKVIWLDASNRPIDVSKMRDSARPNGFPFAVHHTAVFAGRDQDGRPLIAHSRINAGSISTETLDGYLSRGGQWPAMAIVSMEYFVQGNTFAMAPGKAPPK